MNLYVGTSGYSYKEWKGTFYPEQLPAERMLACYAEQFRTVEINNTFHRMPSLSLLEGWAREVPEDFRFALKAPQRITHLKRLKDVDDALSYLFDVTGALQERLGPLLFQLPPSMKKDLPLLRDFLSLLPPGRRVAIQFQHGSWFDDQTVGLLHGCNAALCLVDAEDALEVPLISTGDWGYLRLRRPDYADADLKRWLKRVRAQRWREAFVFFKHEEAAKGPQLAKRLLALAGE